MADPQLDEDYIKALLSSPVSLDNTDAIQSGAAQALIDLYDRKVTREEFMNMAGVCLGLYGQCSKFWLLHSVKGVFEQGNFNDQSIKDAEIGIEQLIRAHAERVIEIVKRLQLCPTSKDPVH